MNYLAKIISTIFAPLVVIVPAAFVLSYLETKNIYVSFGWFFLTLIFVLCLVGCIFVLIKKGKFANFDVSVQKQRPLLILLELSFALVYFFALLFLNAPKELFFGIINIFLLLTTLLIVNKFIKASGHVAILSAIVTFFAFKSEIIYSLIGAILVLTLAWSRLKLKRHTLKEVLAGAAIGVLVVAFLTII